MEVINHPKFLGDNTNIPIPWPEKRTLPNGSQLPLFGNFYFEPSTGTYANYITGPEVKSKMDFVVGPDVQSVGEPPHTRTRTACGACMLCECESV